MSRARPLPFLTTVATTSQHRPDPAALIERHRRRRGLSQNQLARLTAVDPAYVNRIERRMIQGTPSRAVVLRLIGALELETDDGDRLLYAFGYAGQVDWQSAWEQAVASLPAAIEAAVARVLAEGLSVAIRTAEPAPDPPGV